MARNCSFTAPRTSLLAGKYSSRPRHLPSPLGVDASTRGSTSHRDARQDLAELEAARSGANAASASVRGDMQSFIWDPRANADEGPTVRDERSPFDSESTRHGKESRLLAQTSPEHSLQSAPTVHEEVTVRYRSRPPTAPMRPS